MKKYTLTVTGNVVMNSYGDIEVDNVNLLERFTKSFGMEKENYQSKQFAGKVEITITDLSEPLKIDAKEC
ncbi:MAG: hypothetical protein AB7E42_00140 [Anaerotignaceae bacterium]